MKKSIPLLFLFIMVSVILFFVFRNGNTRDIEKSKQTESSNNIENPNAPDTKKQERKYKSSSEMKEKYKDSAGVVSGIVIDSFTNEPISDAMIFIQFPKFDQNIYNTGIQSDLNGEFSVRNLPLGAAIFKLKRDYYIPSSTEIYISKNSEPRDIEIKMEPSVYIAGTVFGENGEPKSDIKIKARKSVFEFNGAEVIPVASKDDGGFVINCPDKGYYFVNAEKEGYISDVKHVRAPCDNIDISLSRGREIYGTVFDKNDDVISDVKIKIQSKDFYTEVVSDIYGTYKTSIPFQDCYVAIYKDNYVSSNPEIISAGKEKIEKNFVLDKGLTLKGLIRNTEGKPVSDAKIRIYKRTESNFFTIPYIYWSKIKNDKQFESNDDGEFIISGVSPGDNFFNISATGHKTLYKGEKITDKTEIVEFTMETGYTISGKVFAPDGNLASGVTIEAYKSGINEDSFVHEEVPTVVVKDGSFVISIKHIGSYVISACSGKLRGTVVAESGTDDVEIFMEENNLSIYGTVFGCCDKKPISGAKVILKSMQSNKFSHTVSDADGRFFIDCLQPGKFIISAKAEDYFEELKSEYGDPNIITIGNEPLEITINMHNGLTVSGQVLDSNNIPVSGIIVREEFFGASSSEATKENGEFVLSGMTRQSLVFFLAACKEDEVLARKRIRVDNNAEEVKGIIIKIPSEKKVYGRVINTEGNPIANAKIEANFDDEYNFTNTDQNGYYEFKKVRFSERIYLGCSANNYLNQEIHKKVNDSSIDIFSSDGLEFNFTLSGGSLITGKVTDENGAPISGARVWVPGNSIPCNSDGTYEIRVPADKPFNTSANAKNYKPTVKRNVDPNIKVLDFVLSPSPVLSGSVFFGDGTVPPEIYLVTEYKSKEGDHMTTKHTVKLDKDGNFKFNLSGYINIITVLYPEYQEFKKQYDTPFFESKNLGKIVLQKTGTP